MSRTGKATHFTGCFFRRGYLVDNFSISFFDSFKRSIRVCSDVDTDTDVALEMKQISPSATILEIDLMMLGNLQNKIEIKLYLMFLSF